MMKFTLAWLKEHLDTDHSLGELADKLTMIGLEVERIEDKAKLFAPFVIARVTEAKQHPNADRLRVCMVDTGSGDPIQVVCGAPNARTGMKGVFAPPGAFIPGKNITLGVGKIRDVESRGMLVSEFELQISDNHEGIIDLPDDAPVGANYAQWAGLDDPVIEINLTPNRADCTGVHGIARDLAAADMGKFKDAAIKPVKGEFPCPVRCHDRGARALPGLRAAPGARREERPVAGLAAKAADRDRACVRSTRWSISPTSSPMTAAGRCTCSTPPKVRGNLTVRRARAGETLLALDGKTYTLDDTMCVIADEKASNRCPASWAARKPAARKTTTDVLIESALWDDQHRPDRPQARHQFRRPLPLRARRRSGLHAAGTRTGHPHGARLCGGTPSEGHRRRQCRGARARHRFSAVRAQAPRRPRGAAAEMRRVLERLGFFVAGQGERVKVAVPSWRPDVQGKADIVEEVVRILGVDRVPPTPFDRGEAPRKPVLTPIQLRTRKAKRALAARNLVEAVTWSFIAKNRRPNCSAAASRSWRSPIRSRPTSPTCGRASFPAWSRPRRRTPIAAFPMSACSKSARCFAATAGKINSPPPPACGARWPSRRASAGIGRNATARSMRSTPRPTRSPC
jgi:phenylalanyl-tRNA synthetase beta chain